MNQIKNSLYYCCRFFNPGYVNTHHNVFKYLPAIVPAFASAGKFVRHAQRSLVKNMNGILGNFTSGLKNMLELKF